MARGPDLTAALEGFAHTLVAGSDVSDMLHDLTARLPDLLGIAGAGVSLRQDGGLRFVTADHELFAQLERLQESEGEGPCVEAFRTGEPVLVPRLTSEAARWPRYVEQATASGVLAVAAIPMRNSDQVGVLDLYDDKVHEWSGEEVATAAVFADVAAAYLLHASKLEQERRTVEQLQHALSSRIIIEQAKGILAAEYQISVDQAFQRLRRHANDHNATLHSVAGAVVELGLRP